MIDYSDWYDSEEDCDFGDQELSNGGKVTIRYIRQQRGRARDSLRYDDGFVLEQRRTQSIIRGKEVNGAIIPGDGQRYNQQHRSVLRNQEHAQPLEVNQNVISFYFTNILHDISYVALSSRFSGVKSLTRLEPFNH